MKRVYLDQNKWIELLRASKGLEDESLVDLLRLVDLGVQMCEVSCPLSSTHYMETCHRREWRSRRELAEFMARVSRFHTIADRGAILRDEVDGALQRRFGRPVWRSEPRVFGYGIGHLLPQDDKLVDVAPEVSRVVKKMSTFAPSSAIRELFELEMLRGPDADEEATMPDYDPLAAARVGDRWAVDRESLRTLRRDGGWLRGERSKDLFRAELLISERAIWERAELAGISRDEITGLGKDGMTALMNDIPTLHVTCELGRLRDVADARPLSGHDLADVGFLGTAVVYCDIVATERLWVELAKRAGLGDKYETALIFDLRDLAKHLV